MVDFRDGRFGSGKANRPVPPPIRLRLGTVGMSPAAEAWLTRWQIDTAELLRRFANGDWGEMDAEDCAQNDAHARAGAGMIMGCYPRVPGQGASGNDRLWVIHYPQTGDTTMILPDEY